MKAIVENTEVQVGDTVGFKSDVEQYGTIIGIQTGFAGQKVLILENKYGFEGGYIGGDTTTQVNADDCWID